MSDREEALEQILRLAARHGIGEREIAAAMRGADAGAQPRGAVVKVLAYLGGIFVFSGIVIYVGLRWDEMNSAARVIVTLGSGLAAFVLAVIAHADERYARATTPLLIIAAALEPTGMLVAFHEFAAGVDEQHAVMITTGAVSLQYLVGFARLRRGTLIFFAILFALGFWSVTMDLFEMDGDLIALTLGASVVLVAWGLERTPYADITPFWFFVGAVAMLSGLFDLVADSALEILFLAAASGLVYLSVVVRSRTLLFVGTVGIICYTGYFTAKHFAESIGWPLALIAFGLIMIGLSAAAFRIDRRYLRG